MTRQELFDTIVRGLVAQGRPAVVVETDEGDPQLNKYACRYRTADGLKCAAGQVITDEEYDADMEGEAFSFIAGRVERASVDTLLVSLLQEAHDVTAIAWKRDEETRSWVDDFKVRARAIAEARELDPKEAL